MKNKLLELLKTQLLKIVNDIDSGNCNLSDEELETAIDNLSILNKGIRRYSKRYLCDNILHCSESCFNTYLTMGITPPGYKEIGFKELRWSIKDLDKALEYRKTH
jgi:hypothetical protein